MIDDSPQKKLHSLGETYRKFAPYMNLGYTLAASVVGLTALGWWADKSFNSRPVFTIIGAVLGIFAGFYHFFKTIAFLEKKQKEKKENGFPSA